MIADLVPQRRRLPRRHAASDCHSTCSATDGPLAECRQGADRTQRLATSGGEAAKAARNIYKALRAATASRIAVAGAPNGAFQVLPRGFSRLAPPTRQHPRNSAEGLHRRGLGDRADDQAGQVIADLVPQRRRLPRRHAASDCHSTCSAIHGPLAKRRQGAGETQRLATSGGEAAKAARNIYKALP